MPTNELILHVQNRYKPKNSNEYVILYQESGINDVVIPVELLEKFDNQATLNEYLQKKANELKALKDDVNTKTAEINQNIDTLKERTDSIDSKYVLEKDLHRISFSGNYNDLSNIPSKLSQFANDSKYLIKSDTINHAINATNSVNADKATNDAAGNNIVNTYATKNELASIKSAEDNAVNTLSNTLNQTINTTKNTLEKSISTLDGSLARVAKTGKYADLSGVPTKVSQFENDRKYLIKTDTIDNATHASNADNASEANHASRSTNDGDGNNIVNTYATKASYTEFTNNINNRLNTIDNRINNINANAGGSSGGSSVSSYYDLKDAPKNVSYFNNDAGYITQHQDLSAYTKDAALARVAKTGNYNDLTNKPSVPTKVSQLTNDSNYVNRNGTIANAEKATYDSNGNKIVDTYLTTEKLNEVYAIKNSYYSLPDAPTIVSYFDNDAKYVTVNDNGQVVLTDGIPSTSEEEDDRDLVYDIRATYDKDGNTITTTYATKDEINKLQKVITDLTNKLNDYVTMQYFNEHAVIIKDDENNS